MNIIFVFIPWFAITLAFLPASILCFSYVFFLINWIIPIFRSNSVGFINEVEY